MGGRVFKVRQMGEKLESDNVDSDFVRDYFGLKDDLSSILSQIKKDRHIEAAIGQFQGLRILHQEPWECLISYICATYKSISAIKHMLSNLSRKFGERVTFDRCDFFTFPTPKGLARATLSELRACGLGYRAEYVRETAKTICEKYLDVKDLGGLPYCEARERLVDFSGVGLKVADCVLLFSLRKFEAFPVDVWMRRVILRHYASNFSKEFVEKISGERSLSNSEYERLSRFGREYFGEYAGYAQEYLYHYERMQH